MATRSQGRRRRSLIGALNWLLPPLLLAGSAGVGVAHGQGMLGIGKISSASGTRSRHVQATSQTQMCREGYEGVTEAEIKEWAEKGWSSGQALDSHIHVWGDGSPPFAYDNPPPEALAAICDADKFIATARNAGISAALIVQPINYKFDHSYVTSVLEKYPKFFKGMALAKPDIKPSEVKEYLSELKNQGYVALRFNPYLWTGSMADESGKAIYKEAGNLGMSVGVMCFKGLPGHVPDIKALLEHSPRTKLIIDHWGFFRQPATGGTDPNTKISEEAWQDLLELSKYPQVYVKLSALFRVSGEPSDYEDLKPRLQDLLTNYGADRLMWGSDYPYALVNGGYCASAVAMRSWKEKTGLSDDQFEKISGANAAAVFGF